MVKYLIILIPLILLGLYGLHRFLSRPPRYRKRADDDLSKFFNALLYDDYETGFLVIEAGKKRFLQFLKYKKGKRAGVQFDFPLAPWSEHYYDALKTTLNDQGIDYDTSKTDQDTVAGFITVDFKEDLEKAMNFAKLVLLDVFELKAEDRIRVYLDT